MSKGIKIPKKVAGVKIPKMVRKGPLGDFLNSSTGQLLIAEALTLVVATVAMRRTKVGQRLGSAVSQGASDLGDDVSGLREDAQAAVVETSTRLSAAFQAAMRAFREELHRDETEVEAAGETVEDALTSDDSIEDSEAAITTGGRSATKRSASGAASRN